MEDLIYIMTEAEQELAQLIWEHEPLRSGELVWLAAEHLNWKKSTTYTVLRKICENGIFQNEQSVVTSRMSQEEYAKIPKLHPRRGTERITTDFQSAIQADADRGSGNMLPGGRTHRHMDRRGRQRAYGHLYGTSAL